jgi:ABC-type cobalamin/Fe3+-siderophores transport system ATPase subunit
MSFDFTVQATIGGPIAFRLAVGDSLLVLGANGAGKSRLMHSLYIPHQGRSVRIAAHRQNYLNTSGVNIAASGRQKAEQQILNYDSRSDTVWFDHDPNTRTSATLFDLANAENNRARKIAAAVDEKRDADAQKLAATERPPIHIINDILRLSNLPLTVSVDESAMFTVSKAGSPPYGIHQLSDGERNAVLLAAQVLTSKPGTLILIDEPERHLHRSIVSPLLGHLFGRRKDCTFIVSTHEVNFALDNPECRVLLVRSAAFQGESPASWDVDLVDSADGIDDSIKADIFGARRRTVFVEGVTGKLDKKIYSIVFGDISVIPRTSCREVEKTVAAIRTAKDLHWVAAFGIVDNDQRTEDEIARLRSDGIYAVPFYSVEALYYHPDIQAAVARRKASVEGGDAAADLQTAKAAALDAIARQASHLAQRRAQLTVRHLVLQAVPKTQDVAAGLPVKIDIDAKAILTAEEKRIRSLIDARDVLSILTRYPVREAGMLKPVARALRFPSTDDYETAVLKALADEPGTLQIIRTLFAELISALAAPKAGAMRGA